MAEVVTGEAVVLDLAVARFPSRMLALIIDVLIQLPIVFFVDIVAYASGARHLNPASAAAIYLSGLVGVVVGYPVIFETLSRGKTLGKMALGMRVVSDDGGPERFRQALVRALALAFIEFWIPPFNIVGLPAGLITSMVSAKGKRLGDVFAGTFVLQERAPRRPDLAPAFAVVPAQLTGWAQHLELSRLSDQTAAAASSYLRRFYQLLPAARDQLGFQIASAVAAQVSPAPPPGTPPAAFLSAVLAVRRERELARVRERLSTQAAASMHFAQPDATGRPMAAAQAGAADQLMAAAPTGDADRPEMAAQATATHMPDTGTRGQPETQVSAPPEDFGFVAPY